MIKLLKQGKSRLPIDCLVQTADCQAMAYYQLKDGHHSGGLELVSPMPLEWMYEPILDLSCTGPTLFGASRGGKVVRVNLEDGSIRQAQLTDQPLLYLHARGDRFAVVSSDGNVHLSDLEWHREMRFTEYSGWSACLMEEEVALCGGDGEGLSICDFRTGGPIKICKEVQGVCELRHQPAKNRVLVGSFRNCLCCVDMRKPGLLFRQPMEGGVWRIVAHDVRTDAYLLAIYDQHYFMVALDRGTELEEEGRLGHDSLAYSCGWREQGIVTASFYDSVVKEWDYKQGKQYQQDKYINKQDKQGKQDNKHQQDRRDE